jgi:hypothetical protein
VWPVDRGCLLLHGTWSHLWYIQGSVYTHSLICISYMDWWDWPLFVIFVISHTRIRDQTDPKVRKEQAGFREGRSCSDQIFTLRQIMEQNDEWICSRYTNFIDFSKAFDIVLRPALWKILAHYGIPNKIISIIKILYTEFEAEVICGTNLIHSFSIQNGVKQGCPFQLLLRLAYDKNHRI